MDCAWLAAPATLPARFLLLNPASLAIASARLVHPPNFHPLSPLPPLMQMNAFCNADDISWGTKNLDTKRADHDAAKMRSKALAYKGGWA